jgi:hypothetical protein
MVQDPTEDEEQQAGRNQVDGADTSSEKPEPHPRVIDRSEAMRDLAAFRIGELAAQKFSAISQVRDLTTMSTGAAKFLNEFTSLQRIADAYQMPNLVGRSLEPLSTPALPTAIGEEWRRVSELLRSIPQPPSGYTAKLQSLADQHSQDMAALVGRSLHFHVVGSALSETMRLASVSAAFTASEAFHRQLDAVGRIQRELNDAWETARGQVWRYAELFKDLPERVKENLVALAEAGWYLDSEMPISELIYFKEELKTGNPHEINAGLADYFRSGLDRIEATLINRHPTRSQLIQDAFSAHREDKWNLSIPALFIQADGICFDLTKQQLFTKRGLRTFVRRLDPETIERAYLEPLLRNIPITASVEVRKRSSPDLNRHAVLHGESTDFGTEVNGLKAISFLNFVSHVLLRASEVIAARSQKRIEGASTPDNQSIGSD